MESISNILEMVLGVLEGLFYQGFILITNVETSVIGATAHLCPPAPRAIRGAGGGGAPQTKKPIRGPGVGAPQPGQEAPQPGQEAPQPRSS